MPRSIREFRIAPNASAVVLRRTVFFLAAAICVGACSTDTTESASIGSESPVAASALAAPEIREGYVDVEGGRVWYRVLGAGDATPLLLLHGGPGAGSGYFEPLAALADERPVIFYDQLGAGQSDRPTDTSLWTIERHLRELDTVRTELGLSEVHILGHSWGSMLLTEYLLTAPEGVASAVFASPLFSTARWLADAKQRLTELPEDVQRTIEAHEAAGTTDSPEYAEATMQFYRRFLLRLDPWPPEMADMSGFGWDTYHYMWGPSEFTATGTLKDWDRMDALERFDLPTLFTVGEFDETFPETVREYASRAANSTFVVIPGAGHMTFLDSPEASVAALRDFLNEVDGGAR